MSDQVIYRQVNKDYAYWIEKRRLGQQKGGHVSGLLTHLQDGQVKQNILIDTGLGTIESLADLCDDSFWDDPLLVLITHGHIDHHAELMILAEIYCTRRGKDIYDVRPALPVYCTAETQKHLFNTHRYGYTAGETLQHCLIEPDSKVQLDVFNVTSLAVDHFEGAVIFSIEFGEKKKSKILIGWDMTTLPLENIQMLQDPSLALIEATTWSDMADEIGHTSVEDLMQSGFLEQLNLKFMPEMEMYGAYLVHYSGREDPWGMLTDKQLKEKIDATFPELSELVQVAQRGQQWGFCL